MITAGTQRERSEESLFSFEETLCLTSTSFAREIPKAALSSFKNSRVIYELHFACSSSVQSSASSKPVTSS